MIILDTTSKSLTLALTATPGTEMSAVAVYADATDDALTEGCTAVQSSGTTPVTLCASPAADTRRVVRNFTVHNPDSVPRTVILSLVDGATTHHLWVIAIAAHKTWDYLRAEAGGGIADEVDPIVGAITGIVKADGAGNISAAAAGTDYQAPLTAGTDYLAPTGDGSGLSGVLTQAAIDVVNDNLSYMAFRAEIQSGMSLYKMQNGIVEGFQDATGMDASYLGVYEPFTKLLLHAEGSNNGTTFTDVMGHTLTAAGNIITSTTQKKFGSTALYLDGTGDSLTASSPDLNFGVQNFCLEWFMFGANNSTTMQVMLDNTAVWNSGAFVVHYKHGSYSTAVTVWIYDVSTTAPALTSGAVAYNGWRHVAITRAGDVLTLWIDGTSAATTTLIPGTPINFGSRFRLGGSNATGFIGYLDEIRVVKGASVYTTNFTPTAAAYAPFNGFDLRSAAFTATAVPTTARLLILEEDVDAVTLNTDLLAYVSRDNGTTWTQVTLAALWGTGERVLGGNVDISGQPSGTNMKWKLVNVNNKIMRLNGVSLMWR